MTQKTNTKQSEHKANQISLMFLLECKLHMWHGSWPSLYNIAQNMSMKNKKNYKYDLRFEYDFWHISTSSC